MQTFIIYLCECFPYFTTISKCIGIWLILGYGVVVFTHRLTIGYNNTKKAGVPVSVSGDSVRQAKTWMLTRESRVIIQPEEPADFSSVLAVLFGCYYVFNVQYQEEAASTLEFIQRFVHQKLIQKQDHSNCHMTM